MYHVRLFLNQPPFVYFLNGHEILEWRFPMSPSEGGRQQLIIIFFLLEVESNNRSLSSFERLRLWKAGIGAGLFMNIQCVEDIQVLIFQII